MNSKDLFKLIFSSNLKIKSEALGVYSIGHLNDIYNLEVIDKIMGLLKNGELTKDYPKDFGAPMIGSHTTFEIIVERLGVSLVGNDMKFTEAPNRGLLELSFNKNGEVYDLVVQDIF